MNDIAYDISHLLDVEPPRAETPAPRPVRAVPSVAVRPAAPAAPSLAELQEATARELMQSAAAHDALVQEFLCSSGQASLEDDGRQTGDGQGSLPLFE